jgi:hypothetical protein
MGISICREHGTQPNFLACEHVTRAMRADASAPPYRRHEFAFDVGSNSEVRIALWLCGSCAAACELRGAVSTSERNWELYERASGRVDASCFGCTSVSLFKRFPPEDPAPAREID